MLAAALAASPAGGAPPEPGSAAAAHAAPLLWRVEKGGRTSHLFGTVHVGLDLDAALHDAGRVALDDAKRVFVEFDLTSPAAIVALVYDALARGELPRGRSLRTLLRPETWNRLPARYKGRVPPATLDRMEPWFAVLTLPLVAAPGGTGAGVSRRPAPILDAAIVARAKAHGARVMALDTPLEGIEAFSAIGRKEGARMLEQLLATDVESQRHEIEGLIGAYVSDDDRHLVKAFGRLWRREPAVAEQILFRRNERWCERLALWLGDGGVFVAAGTFHMFGDRGLVELLRRRGYRVERVRGLGAEPSESPGEREPAVAAGAVEDALDARVHAAQRDLAPARVEEPPPVRAEPAPVQRARRRDREREQHDESEHGAHHPWPRSCISATIAPRA